MEWEIAKYPAWWAAERMPGERGATAGRCCESGARAGSRPTQPVSAVAWLWRCA